MARRTARLEFIEELLLVLQRCNSKRTSAEEEEAAANQSDSKHPPPPPPPLLDINSFEIRNNGIESSDKNRIFLVQKTPTFLEEGKEETEANGKRCENKILDKHDLSVNEGEGRIEKIQQCELNVGRCNINEQIIMNNVGCPSEILNGKNYKETEEHHKNVDDSLMSGSNYDGERRINSDVNITDSR